MTEILCKRYYFLDTSGIFDNYLLLCFTILVEAIAENSARQPRLFCLVIINF